MLRTSSQRRCSGQWTAQTNRVPRDAAESETTVSDNELIGNSPDSWDEVPDPPEPTPELQRYMDCLLMWRSHVLDLMMIPSYLFIPTISSSAQSYREQRQQHGLDDATSADPAADGGRDE